MASNLLRTSRICEKNINTQLVLIVRRKSASKVDEKPTLEPKKNAAHLSTSQLTYFDGDMIGPAHPVSNLRSIIWHRSPSETQLQRKLKNFQEETQSWNQNFWETHNSNFINERKVYIKQHLPNDSDKQTLTADEMSHFYKEFLDKNWKTHANYNFQWYKKNCTILLLSLAVSVEKIFRFK